MEKKQDKVKIVNDKKKRKQIQYEEDDEDEDEEDEEEVVTKKRGKRVIKKAVKKSEVEVIIEKISDTKVVLGIVAIIGFIMYSRSKQNEMQMMLKMKELEL